MGEVKRQRKIKDANAFKNPGVGAATRLLLFDWLVSKCKTHLKNQGLPSSERCRDIDNKFRVKSKWHKYLCIYTYAQ
jgi:hypothetical protein